MRTVSVIIITNHHFSGSYSRKNDRQWFSACTAAYGGGLGVYWLVCDCDGAGELDCDVPFGLDAGGTV